MELARDAAQRAEAERSQGPSPQALTSDQQATGYYVGCNDEFGLNHFPVGIDMAMSPLLGRKTSRMRSWNLNCDEH